MNTIDEVVSDISENCMSDDAKTYTESDVESLEDNMETWKNLKLFPLYDVSNYGRIRNNKIKKLRKLTTDKYSGGYVKVLLYKKNTEINKYSKKMAMVHRLVISEFDQNYYLLEGDDSSYVVNHKDGIKENNTIDNLEIITQKENSSEDKKMRPIEYSNKCMRYVDIIRNDIYVESLKIVDVSKKYNLTIQEIVNRIDHELNIDDLELNYTIIDNPQYSMDNEEFRDTKCEYIKISNIGRVKNTKKNYYYYGSLNCGNTLTINYLKKSNYRVCRLVAEFFIDENINNFKLVYHIDGNAQNNKLSNLLLLTRDEINARRNLSEMRIQVYQYDWNGNFIQQFAAMSHARDIAWDVTIRKQLEGHYHLNNKYLWVDHLLPEAEFNEILLKRNSTSISERVYLYDLCNGVNHIYYTYKSAIDYINNLFIVKEIDKEYKKTTFHRHIKSPTKYGHNFGYAFEEDLNIIVSQEEIGDKVIKDICLYSEKKKFFMYVYDKFTNDLLFRCKTCKEFQDLLQIPDCQVGKVVMDITRNKFEHTDYVFEHTLNKKNIRL